MISCLVRRSRNIQIKIKRRERDRDRDRETERDTDRETERDTDRETERDRDRETETERRVVEVAGSPRDVDYNDPRHDWCCRGTHRGGTLRFTASARRWGQVHLHGAVVLRQHANDRHRSASTLTEYSLSSNSNTVSINSY